MATQSSTSLAIPQLVKGSPQNKTQLFFGSEDGDFVSGTWESTPGTWRGHSGKDEVCYLKGHVRLISDCGTFVVPNGFSGLWEVVEDTVKHYAIRKYR